MSLCKCPITNTIQLLMYESTFKAVQISKANGIMPEIRKVTGGKEKSLCKKGKLINLFGYTYILKPFSRFTYLSFVRFVTLIWNFEKCIKVSS